MNNTITSLTLSNFFSPFLYKSRNHNSYDLKLVNIHLEQFGSYLFFSRFGDHRLFIAGSKFQRFLSSVVFISNIVYKKMSYDLHNRNLIDKYYSFIYQTVFSHCHSAEKGGSIYIENILCYLKLFNCGFFNCTSESSDGAVFFKGRSAIVFETCFQDCYVNKEVQIGSHSCTFSCLENYFNSVNHSSITSCSPYDRQSSASTISYYYGSIQLIENNCSFNNAKSSPSGFHLVSSGDESSIRYDLFIENSGDTVLSIRRLKMRDEFDYLTFQQNSANSMIFLDESTSLVFTSVFEANTGIVCSSKDNSYIIFNNCYFDENEDNVEFGSPVVTCSICHYKGNPYSISHKYHNPLFCWNNCQQDKGCKF